RHYVAGGGKPRSDRTIAAAVFDAVPSLLSCWKNDDEFNWLTVPRLAKSACSGAKAFTSALRSVAACGYAVASANSFVRAAVKAPTPGFASAAAWLDGVDSPQPFALPLKVLTASFAGLMAARYSRAACSLVIAAAVVALGTDVMLAVVVAVDAEPE